MRLHEISIPWTLVSNVALHSCPIFHHGASFASLLKVEYQKQHEKKVRRFSACWIKTPREDSTCCLRKNRHNYVRKRVITKDFSFMCRRKRTNAQTDYCKQEHRWRNQKKHTTSAKLNKPNEPVCEHDINFNFEISKLHQLSYVTKVIESAWST